MKRLLVTALILAVAIPAFAGGNPNVTAYLTFDPAGLDMPRLDPTPFSQHVVYMCLKHVDAGFTTLTFGISDPGVTTGLGWNILIPGGLALGTYPVGVSITGSGCVTDEITVVAAGTGYFFASAPGEIKIIDHPDYPRWVVDCNDVIDYYCLETNAGVLMDPTPTGEDCAGVSPVEVETWGGIKALYR